jgi:hypothetical protein
MLIDSLAADLTRRDAENNPVLDYNTKDTVALLVSLLGNYGY